ncbi:MAG: molybdopterin molybdotransferase MoeA [Geminicoccaceae bacterium]
MAALERLRQRIDPIVGRETVSLAQAAGRVLAAPLVSPRAVPAFDNAAVDGFAFAATSQASTGPTRLALVADRAAAGHPAAAVVPPGHAMRVLTGAVMPAGTDTVAMQEEVIEDGSSLTLARPMRPSSNRRRAGEDIAAGAALFAPGLVLRPHHVAVAAEIGLAYLPVFKRLRLALLSSGDELREPGGSLPPGALFDANRYLLQGLLRNLPVEVDDLGILPDDAGAVASAMLAAAGTHHVILTSGGAFEGRRGPRGPHGRAARPPAFLADRDEARPPFGLRQSRRGADHRPARQPGRRRGLLHAPGAPLCLPAWPAPTGSSPGPSPCPPPSR